MASSMHNYDPNFIASIDELIAEFEREQVIQWTMDEAVDLLAVDGDSLGALVLWDAAKQMEVCA